MPEANCKSNIWIFIMRTKNNRLYSLEKGQTNLVTLKFSFNKSCDFNGHRYADKRANSFWQLLHFFSTELLVFLACWPTGKEFRLSWHSFVRVENRLSIKEKCKLFESWIFHSEVVRASAWRSRGREFESRSIHFLYQSFYFFYFLVFPFLFISILK